MFDSFVGQYCCTRILLKQYKSGSLEAKYQEMRCGITLLMECTAAQI